MDFDFGIGKKSQAKSGRRARSSKSHASLNTNEKESVAPPEPIPAPEVGKNSPARPSRRMGGWGESTSRPGVEDSRLLQREDSPRTRLESSDDDGGMDIEMIPDDNAFQSDDIASKMAAPPSMSMSQVATYRELDSDLQRRSTFTLLDNEIDLKLLTKHMSVEDDVREKDAVWEWDGLFAQVSSDLKSQTKQKTDILSQGNLI